MGGGAGGGGESGRGGGGGGGGEVELCDQQENFAGYVYLSDLMGEGLELDDDEIEEVLEEEFEDDEDDEDGDINAAPDDGPAYDPTAGLLN